jgi:hypothetical protein
MFGVAQGRQGAGGAKAGVIDQDDQHIGRALGGRSGVIGGYLVAGSRAS